MKIKLLLLLFLMSLSTYAQNTNISTYVPTNGLLAYYPFTGNANDVSENGYNGTVTGATLTTDRFGNADKAYSFDAVSSYIDAVIATIPQNNTPRTISGWFKTNTPNSNENLKACIFNYGSLSKAQRFALSIYSKGYLQTENGPDFSNDDFYVNNFNYLSNDWYFFALTYDGTNVSLFVNGNYVSGKTVSLNTINKTFRIGKRIAGDTYNEYFKGSIDDIGIWNRVLTQEEITGLYSSNDNLYTLIPDVNFENKLITIGIDSGVADGKVLTSSISKLTALNISSSSISDLTGIQDFVALESLDCQKNNLTTLDISKNGKLIVVNCSVNKLTNLINTSNLGLTNLNCSTNQLTSLDVSKYTLLTNLSFSSNKITTIDVSSNNMLLKLLCTSNLLSELNITNNTSLIQLYCGGNQLTNLDVTKNVNLKYFYCYNNQITSLDVSQNINLLGFMCNSNEIKTIDISNNPKLDFFDCLNNNITSLDISKNPLITELACENNQLTYLNLKNGFNTILDLTFSNFVNNPNLTCILVDDITYSNTNWANLKDATASYNTDCTPYTLIPDANFESKLIALGIDSGVVDGKVTTTSITEITSLDVSFSSIADLTGIQDFISLEKLICKENLITSLDVSKSIALTFLDCSNNPLTALDVSKNKLLTELYCNGSVPITSKTGKTMASSGQLINLDLSNNLLLAKLNCSNNQLLSLDVSKNTLLTYLNCSNNKLNYLNLNNGNNNNLLGVDFKINSSLTYIQVDNEAYSDANWAGAKDITATYSSTLGLEDSVFDKITLYPNPTKGQLHINKVVLEKVTVYNALGKLIKTTSFTSGSNDNVINLAGLPKGVYYINLQSQGITTTRKIAVE
ncbi:LamG-like jellyroll fold domain-containing protein [Flavobacterium sp. ZT3R17]|uniref:LamG-like jellyroll fold domain-containing protein n=1 Tax=Flavobacterium cryoconiti TaxID=3398736 RepID=UPI003A83EC6C